MGWMKKENNDGLTLIERVKSWLKGNNKGFTLIEIVTVLGVTSIMAAVLAPMSANYIGNAANLRAQADVQAIGSAIATFGADTRRWPVYIDASDSATATLTLLASPGDAPEVIISGDRFPGNTAFDTTAGAITEGSLIGQLNTNTPKYKLTGNSKWQGSYLEDITDDPWGNKYYVTIEPFQPLNLSPADGVLYTVFVLSAGPNQVIETAEKQIVTDFKVGGDDVVYRIR